MTAGRISVHNDGMTTERYIDMTPERLREVYTTYRQSLHRWTQLATPRRRDGGRSADGTGRCLREVEFIENVARKRGIRL